MGSFTVRSIMGKLHSTAVKSQLQSPFLDCVKTTSHRLLFPGVLKLHLTRAKKLALPARLPFSLLVDPT